MNGEAAAWAQVFDHLAFTTGSAVIMCPSQGAGRTEMIAPLSDGTVVPGVLSWNRVAGRLRQVDDLRRAVA